MLFPWSEYYVWYAAFCIVLVILVFLDLCILYRRKHTKALSGSVWEALGWVGLALLFGAGLYLYLSYQRGLPGVAQQVFLEFLTGFIIEKALAIDNIFVFIVIFKVFSIDATLQPLILIWGIIGAIVFRAILIALGAYMMQFEAVVWGLGALLILAGIKVFYTRHTPVPLQDNKFLAKLMASGRIGLDPGGSTFFFRSKTGRWMITPALLALIAVEMTDVVFALDSVPAIFAITREPFIVFTSNVFAILGLRALYGCLSGFIERFHYLKYGLGSILIFAGLKMAWLNHQFGGHFPIRYSLTFIVMALVIPVICQKLQQGRVGSSVVKRGG